jgi:hypothetical protein
VNDAGAYLLDAPRYLFVSTNLAAKFPHLLESVIVSSYHSYSPGPFADIWRFGRSRDPPWWSILSGNHRGKKFVLSNVIIAVLQRIGSMSPVFQRLLIHGLQPLFVSCLFFLWQTLSKHPVWWALVGALLLYGVGVLLWGYVHRERDLGDIYPAKTNEIEVHPLASSPPHDCASASSTALTPVVLEVADSQVGVLGLEHWHHHEPPAVPLLSDSAQESKEDHEEDDKWSVSEEGSYSVVQSNISSESGTSDSCGESRENPDRLSSSRSISSASILSLRGRAYSLPSSCLSAHSSEESLSLSIEEVRGGERVEGAVEVSGASLSESSDSISLDLVMS